MADNPNKWRAMESEMDRFEAEISSLGSGGAGGGGPSPSGPPSSAPPPIRPPSGLFIPASVVRRAATTVSRPAGPVIISGAPQVYKSNAVLTKGPVKPSTTTTAGASALPQQPPQSVQIQIPRHVRPSLIPGAPQIITTVGTGSRLMPLTPNTSSIDSNSDGIDAKDLKHDQSAPGSSHDSHAKGSSSDAAAGSSSGGAKGSGGAAGKKKKKKSDEASGGGGNPPAEKKPKKHVRSAGGTVWEDPTLLDWDTSDFRLFCGDLGNDVTDEVLARVFARYPSFQKAKVVRDKRTNKTRGYGFVSFKDPNDFVRAIRELDGRYVGSRPIKLRKSTWRSRGLNQVRKREKEFKQLMGPKKAKL